MVTSRKGATGSSTAGTGPLGGGGGNGSGAGPSVLPGDKGTGDLGGGAGTGRAAGAPMDQDGKPGSGDVREEYIFNCICLQLMESSKLVP